MKLPFYLLFSFFVSSSYHLIACTCLVDLNLCENTNTDSKVFLGEVIEKYAGNDLETFMDVKVIEEIQGDFSEEILTIINHGTSCDTSFDGFEIGDTFIYNFTETPAPHNLANYPIFSLSPCAASFLKKEGNTVLGNIDEGVSSQNYDVFKNEINQCVATSIIDIDSDFIDDFINVIPNPTLDFITIDIPITIENISANLFSCSGQLIASFEDISMNETLDLSQIPRGVYFLKININEHSGSKKIMKL